MNGWPALEPGGGPWPPSLEYERGVWGKVHGMPSDFRWIARSSAFGERQPGLERQLNIGGEDVPSVFQAWRNLGDRCYAVACYPSRASDAAGRRGFLEKQILEWRRPAHLPAAVGAILLLTYAANLSDEIWWGRYSGEPWSNPEFSLPIHPAGAEEPLAIEAEDLFQKIQHGREVLREAVGPASLKQLYDQLLSGRQPAMLAGLRQPLPPEALAALLLPLPRTIADQISLGGWIPSTRPPLQELGSRWHILVSPADSASRDLEAAANDRAWSMAEQLLAQEPGPSHDRPPESPSAPPPPATETVSALIEPPPDPPAVEVALPGPRFALRLTKPEAETPRILRELYEFARSSERRWLDPETLRQRCSGQIPRLDPRDASSRLLATWIRQVNEQRPPYAHGVQWQVKADLLRSAALVLVPAPSTLEAVGLPESGLVQALFFALLLETRNQRDLLGNLGEKTLRQVLAQSLACRATPKTRNVGPWIARWRIETQRRDPDILRLIDEAMAARSR